MDGETVRDLAWLEVPLVGALEETGDRWMPFRLADPSGAVVEPVSAFFADLLAAGRSEATVRSYGMDLLSWFRFVWAAGVPWNMATRAEARDFCRWMSSRARSARKRSASAKRPGSARHGWTPGPVNGCRSCQSWSPPWTSSAEPPPSCCARPGWPNPARLSLPPARPWSARP